MNFIDYALWAIVSCVLVMLWFKVNDGLEQISRDLHARMDDIEHAVHRRMDEYEAWLGAAGCGPEDLDDDSAWEEVDDDSVDDVG